jgi:hypothetical protein
MAFTLPERQSVRKYLGWSGRYYQTDSRLEQAMNAIATETETEIRVELTRIASLETEMDAARRRWKAAKVGSIELQGATEFGLLRSAGRQAAGRIASMLGVEIRHDAFSATGPSGSMSLDGFSGGDNWLPIG